MKPCHHKPISTSMEDVLVAICLHNFPNTHEMCNTNIFTLADKKSFDLTMAEYFSHVYKCSPDLTPAHESIFSELTCIGARRLSHFSYDA